MRIAILTHNYPLNSLDRKDAGAFVFDFAQALARKIEKVYIFCPNAFGKKKKYRTVPVTWFPWLGGEKKLGHLNFWPPKNLFRFFSLLKEGKKEIIPFVRKNKIDFCMAIWVFPNGLYALQAKKKLKIPYGFWALGSDIYIYGKYPILRNLVKKVIKEADLRCGNSYDICHEARELSGFPCRFFPASTGLNFANKKAIKLNSQRFNFLFVGRLEKVKGPDVLLNAVSQLIKKRNDFNIYFLGDGLLRKNLQEQKKEAGLNSNVFFLGNIGDPDTLASYFLGADFLVIPSRSESMPMVLIEALRAGLPMLVSDVGGMPTLVRKNELGLVFRKESINSLLRNLIKILKEGKNFKLKYQKNLAKVANRFELETIVEKFINEVDHILKT